MSNVKGSDAQNPGTPGDRNEFIELYNFSYDTIDLSNYKITDLLSRCKNKYKKDPTKKFCNNFRS